MTLLTTQSLAYCQFVIQCCSKIGWKESKVKYFNFWMLNSMGVQFIFCSHEFLLSSTAKRRRLAATLFSKLLVANVIGGEKTGCFSN